VADIFTKEKRSEIMSRIHSGRRKRSWTSLELRVHNWLKARHIRHRMMPSAEGSPDVVIFPDNGGDPLYVFIDGCFWHCCPIHYRRPKSNVEYWISHVEESDRRREELRRRLPYRWIRVWEHEVRDNSFKEKILGALGNR